MDGVWAEDFEEDDDFLDFYGEAEEVPEPQRKKIKVIDDHPDAAKEPRKIKVVQNPRPKLDVELLLNEERGLPELLRLSNKILFKPGNEMEDMKQTLNIMQSWAHRLFPKYNFQDFLTKAEALGKKRPIKTYLRKTRIGML